MSFRYNRVTAYTILQEDRGRMLPETIVALFRSAKMNTLEIAKALNTTEAEIYNMLSRRNSPCSTRSV